MVFLQKLQKSSHIHFYFKRDAYKVAQKVTKHFGFYLRKFVTENFQKSPNLVTLLVTQVLICLLSNNITTEQWNKKSFCRRGSLTLFKKIFFVNTKNSLRSIVQWRCTNCVIEK